MQIKKPTFYSELELPLQFVDYSFCLNPNISLIFSILFVLASCSTKKNALVNRGYHNLTARYNGLYYSTLNMNEGIYKIEKNNNENLKIAKVVRIKNEKEKTYYFNPEVDSAGIINTEKKWIIKPTLNFKYEIITSHLLKKENYLF